MSVQPASGVNVVSLASSDSAAVSERGRSSVSVSTRAGMFRLQEPAPPKRFRGGRVQCRVDRSENAWVTGTATEITRQRGLDLLQRCAFLQRHCSEDHPRSADAALRAAMFDERILQRLAGARLRRAFNRDDLAALSVRRR